MSSCIFLHVYVYSICSYIFLFTPTYSYMAVSRLFRDWQGKHLPPIPAGTRLRFGQDTFRIYAAPALLNWVLGSGPGFRVLGSGSRPLILGSGSWVLGSGSRVLRGSGVLGAGLWSLGLGSWVPGPGFRVLGSGSWVPGPGP